MPRDILIKVRERIADPKHWTKHASARDQDGFSINPRSAEAFCWCLYGAVRATTVAYDDVMFELDSCAPDDNDAIGFNDDPLTTHADVLNLIDAAIAANPQ